MGFSPTDGWEELCEDEEVDGGRRERGITGPTLMLCARNSLLYSLCASHRVQTHYYFLQIFVYASCMCASAQIIECSLIFLRVSAKTCGGGGDGVRTGT